MADFPPINSNQYYQPLFNPTSDQPPNYPPNSNQPSIQENKPYNSSGTNASYRTPCSFIKGIIVVVLFICSVGMSIPIIISGELYLCIISIIFALIAIIMGSIFVLYYSIDVYAALGTIIINEKKICLCCGRKEKIQINTLLQVIIQTDYSTNYKIGGVHYNAFEIIFKLKDGKEIKGFSGVIDKNGEGRRVFLLMRNALPQNIAFGGNLAY